MGTVRVPDPPRNLNPPNPASPRPPRGGSGQSDPSGRYKDDIIVIEVLKKEMAQMQVANNEMNAELHRYKERERLGIEDESVDQKRRNVESAEDMLWHSQGELSTEKAYAKGFATVAVISAPAAISLTWGILAVDHVALVTFLIVFGFLFGILSLFGIAATIAKVFGSIPEAKRQVEKNQRVLSRAVLREMELS